MAGKSTRLLVLGGRSSSAQVNIIEYIETASTSNSIDFGDLHATVSLLSATSSSVKVVTGGGISSVGNYKQMNQSIIASLGNSTDFGDLQRVKGLTSAASNQHGGIS